MPRKHESSRGFEIVGPRRRFGPGKGYSSEGFARLAERVRLRVVKHLAPFKRSMRDAVKRFEKMREHSDELIRSGKTIGFESELRLLERKTAVTEAEVEFLKQVVHLTRIFPGFIGPKKGVLGRTARLTVELHVNQQGKIELLLQRMLSNPKFELQWGRLSESLQKDRKYSALQITRSFADDQLMRGMVETDRVVNHILEQSFRSDAVPTKIGLSYVNNIIHLLNYQHAAVQSYEDTLAYACLKAGRIPGITPDFFDSLRNLRKISRDNTFQVSKELGKWENWKKQLMHERGPTKKK